MIRIDKKNSSVETQKKHISVVWSCSESVGPNNVLLIDLEIHYITAKFLLRQNSLFNWSNKRSKQLVGKRSYQTKGCVV